jgi:hypothetical protein
MTKRRSDEQLAKPALHSLDAAEKRAIAIGCRPSVLMQGLEARGLYQARRWSEARPAFKEAISWVRAIAQVETWMARQAA